MKNYIGMCLTVNDGIGRTSVTIYLNTIIFVQENVFENAV